MDCSSSGRLEITPAEPRNMEAGSDNVIDSRQGGPVVASLPRSVIVSPRRPGASIWGHWVGISALPMDQLTGPIVMLLSPYHCTDMEELWRESDLNRRSDRCAGLGARILCH